MNQRGLDSGLAKAAPTAENLTAKNYRSYRRRLALFEKQCTRRGNNVAIEGAFLVLSLLQDSAWDAAEQLDIDEIENHDKPFEPILRLLDRLYQYEDDVELPARCEEFFQEFSRNKGEEMQMYIIRHATLRKKMKEAGVDVPDLLAGWHLMARAGVPRWTHLQVKSLCNGQLTYQKVSQALMKMFGGDHKPNMRDLQKTTAAADNNYYADVSEDQAFYYDDTPEEWDDGYVYEDTFHADDVAEEVYFDDYDYANEGEEGLPEELEHAVDAMDEAFMNYTDSRRRMRDIALSRGFFPVVAMPPSDWSPSTRPMSGGKGKAKGKGRGKGKGKGKGGKGFEKGGFRRLAFNRRPTAGLPREAAANMSPPSSDLARSTGSGSTTNHGPRFKRYRLQDAGVKPAEDANMVEDVRMADLPEEILFSEVTAGHAIMDSGATRSVVGEGAWQQWLPMLGRAGADVTAKKVTRDFRFGDGSVVRSNTEVSFNVCLFGHNLTVSAALIPGGTPLLLARPVLEEWKVVQDYATGRIKLLDGDQWISPARTTNGHYLLKLVDHEGDQVMANDTLNEIYVETPLIVFPGEYPDDMFPEDDVASLVEMKVDEAEIKEAIRSAEQAIYYTQSSREKIFWELYVDRGNLSQAVAHVPGATVSTFSLPDWNLEDPTTQKAFKKLMCEVVPSHIWMTPPYTLWSSMQNFARQTEAQKRALLMKRRAAVRTTLTFAYEVFLLAIELGIFVTIENPAQSVIWKTHPISELRGAGIHDVLVERCQTGLVATDENGCTGPVRKATLLKTTSTNMVRALYLPCTCTVAHVQVLKEVQNYEPGFVRLAKRAIQRDMEETWARRQAANIMMMEDMETVPDGQQAIEANNRDLLRKAGRNAVLTVAKLHKQLGHPGRERLLEAVRSSQLGPQVLQAARGYRCSVCEQHSTNALARPGALPSTTAFNQTLLVDTFYVRWNGAKKAVLAMMDAFSRFEQMAHIKDDLPETEIELLETHWLRWAGAPSTLKTDASGAHMSESFLSWTDNRGVRLVIIPKDAHYRLGAMERAHAVRRAQLSKMHSEEPSLPLEKAVVLAAEQRNRLRTVHGSSPAAIVFGQLPPGHGMDDEPFSAAAGDHGAQRANERARALAAAAFHEANSDRALRASFLARGRADLPSYPVGSYVYYYRAQGSGAGSGKLSPMGRWRGPALVCAVEEPSAAGPGAITYWLAHGSSLVRCAPEQLRAELPPERARRLHHAPASEALLPVMDQVRSALRPVRGPVRSLDLTSHPVPADAGNLGTPDLDVDVGDNSGVAPPDYFVAMDDGPPEVENPKRNDAEAETPCQGEQCQPQQQPAQHEGVRTETEMPDQDERLQQQPVQHKGEGEPRPQPKPEKERERSRSPPPEVLREAMNRARRLDGLPRLPDQEPVPVKAGDVDMDEDDELLFYEDAYLVATEVRENQLSVEEKAAFDAAKDDALKPWSDNCAWIPVDKSEAQPGEAVPMRFLLKYKNKDGVLKPNARIILQGFRHSDVLSKKLETESPTLSRTGRSLLLALCVQMGWKVFSADVKSAFLQADNIEKEVRLYAVPNRDIRQRLSRLIGLKDYQIMKVVKPAFGDVRAPRQWYGTADRVKREELHFLRHQLDRCLYMSTRLATKDDHPYRVFQNQNERCVVDGVVGLHVDDVIGGGEHVLCKNDVMQPGPEDVQCFKDRARRLFQRFRFGSIDFTYQQVFCGLQVEQSMGHDVIGMSLKKYVHSVKPITLDKARKLQPGDQLEETEVAKLRSLLGALAWPATQCLPMLSASVSLLQASMSSPTVADIIEANKTLRFAKECVDRYVWKMHDHVSGNLAKLVFGVYSDAAWAVRPDGASQGGYVIFIANIDEVESSKPFLLSAVDWSSRKLIRTCRSSLAAETQAAATAVDELEWAKALWTLMLRPLADPASDEVAAELGCFAIVDAKSLYDAANSMSAGLKLSERRSAIELAGTNERLRAMKGHWKWCNSSQQLADGLTKTAARVQSLESFARGVISMRFDEAMTAAKKVTQAAKDAEQKELDEAAKNLSCNRRDVNLVAETYAAHDTIIEMPKCQLPGCNKTVPENERGFRICSRRHYYKGMCHGDQARVRAVMAATVLANQACGAEGRVPTTTTRPGDEGAANTEGFPMHLTLDVGWLLSIFITILLVLTTWTLWSTTRRSSSSSPTAPTTKSSTSAASTSATPRETKAAAVQAGDIDKSEADRLREQLILRNQENVQCRVENLRIRDLHNEMTERVHARDLRIATLEEQILRLQRRVQTLQQDVAQPAFQAPDRVHFTPHGRRYHVSSYCGHLQGNTGVRTLTPCGDCSR